VKIAILPKNNLQIQSNSQQNPTVILHRKKKILKFTWKQKKKKEKIPNSQINLEKRSIAIAGLEIILQSHSFFF
jgi:hypothetical protein